jgi:hypothetical protein
MFMAAMPLLLPFHDPVPDCSIRRNVEAVQGKAVQGIPCRGDGPRRQLRHASLCYAEQGKGIPGLSVEACLNLEVPKTIEMGAL